MPQKKHRTEMIVAKLRQVNIFLSHGPSVARGERSFSVAQFTYYLWRKESGGVKTDQMKGSVPGGGVGGRARSPWRSAARGRG